MFSQAPGRDSHDLCRFFPPRCTFSMVRTIACSLCHLVRVTFTIAVGKVAKIARWCPPGLSRCCATHLGSLQRVAALLIFLSCCLAHALSARCSRLLGLTLLPAEFLDTREAGICAGSRAWFSFSFSSFDSAHDDMCPVTSGSFREMSVQALMKIEGPAIA